MLPLNFTRVASIARMTAVALAVSLSGSGRAEDGPPPRPADAAGPRAAHDDDARGDLARLQGAWIST